MKLLLTICALLYSITTSSCNRPVSWYLDKLAETRPEEPREKVSFEEHSRRSRLGWAILTDNVAQVKQYMEDGYDPNKSYDEGWWGNATPLNMIAGSFFTTYYRRERGEEIPSPPPDVAMLELLVVAGAKVNERPYVWLRVYTYSNRSLENALRQAILGHTGQYAKSDADMKKLRMQEPEAFECFIGDANRVIEAFLKAGANPDMLGHPTPFSGREIAGNMTDERAAGYFAQGTRPINEAIKKGMWWESQVDLLLQYTTLDEDSLKAAKESNDPAMIEKITRLWNEQEAAQ